MIFEKPFTNELLNWLDTIEKKLSPKRKLEV
jgi:hypothetical protein